MKTVSISHAVESYAKRGQRATIRHPQNPYPEGTAYALAFDLLASHPAGMHRDQLTRDYARLTGKPIARARFDIAIVLSAQDSPTGPRHRSAKEGYWVRKENDHVQLILGGTNHDLPAVEMLCVRL